MQFAEQAFVHTFRATLGLAAHVQCMTDWLRRASRHNWLAPLFSQKGQEWQIESLGLALLFSGSSIPTHLQIESAMRDHSSHDRPDSLDENAREIVQTTVGERRVRRLLELADQKLVQPLTTMMCRTLFVDDHEDLRPWFAPGGNLAIRQEFHERPVNSHGVVNVLVRLGVTDYLSHGHSSFSGAILGQFLLHLQQRLPLAREADLVIDGFRDPEGQFLREAHDRLRLNPRFLLMAIVYGGFTIHQIQNGLAIKNWHMARAHLLPNMHTVAYFHGGIGLENELAVDLQTAWKKLFYYM